MFQIRFFLLSLHFTTTLHHRRRWVACPRCSPPAPSLTFFTLLSIHIYPYALPSSPISTQPCGFLELAGEGSRCFARALLLARRVFASWGPGEPLHLHLHCSYRHFSPLRAKTAGGYHSIILSGSTVMTFGTESALPHH